MTGKEGRNVRFEETQAFPVWAYVVLALATPVSLGPVFLAPGGSARWSIALTVLITLGVAANLLCLRTTVDETTAAMTFGWLFPLYRRRITLSDIASAQPVLYSPLGEYGGWGIRGWGDDVALNARGDRGVRLTLTSGKRVLIGSQRAEELAAALLSSSRA